VTGRPWAPSALDDAAPRAWNPVNVLSKCHPKGETYPPRKVMAEKYKWGMSKVKKIQRLFPKK
jgi:hypothetical protein